MAGHRDTRAPGLPRELARLRRYGLIIVDEVGNLPFEQDAANPFFQLVFSRYEHASLILTSNLPFSGWGTVFGDQAAAATIDRIVHHAGGLISARRIGPRFKHRRHPGSRTARAQGLPAGAGARTPRNWSRRAGSRSTFCVSC